MKKFFTTIPTRLRRLFKRVPSVRVRLVLVALAIVVSDLGIVLQPFLDTKTYALGGAEDLLTKKNSALASKLNLDSTKGIFNFSTSAAATGESANVTATNGIKATLNQDISKGITVVDSTNNVDFGMTPLDKHEAGKKDGNRVVYPMTNGRGWSVYTAETSGIKEDVILTSSSTDTTTLSYDLSLGNGLIARMETDGSIGVYGNTLLSGQVTTATDADAKLLEAARKNADKTTLLFLIPKPTVIERDKLKTNVTAHYVLDGTKLNVVVNGLSNATYPLTIDPTIFVATARQFMAGNNETNVDFNVDQQLIEKGRTTGARFDNWTTTTALPAPVWTSAAAVAGGYIYSVGGVSYQGQIFNNQGSSSFVVPTGVTSMTIKLWGGGGGGGGGARTGAAGGGGGGGGFTQSTISVTPGETLNVYVGGGGGGGGYNAGGNDAGGGGGGGGFSSIYRGSTALALAAAGGGGGGARNALNGPNGGAGGGTSGVAGSSAGASGGGGGTSSSGGSGGTGGNNNGSAGSSLAGGDGADGRSSNGVNGSGASGGLASGGNGGSPNVNTTRAGGGGGGAGYFGGGGGAGSTSSNVQAGGGGGGGSSYTVSGSTGVSNTTGSGSTPGNSGDAARNGAGDGGAGGPQLNSGSTGAGGLALITYGAGSVTSPSVNWAQFNTTTGTIDSANPGNGTCSGWCTNSAYDLPSARSSFSLVAYSGYLYAVGGVDSSGNRTNSVYIAKLGANGEPRLWHPTNTNPTSWVYWYQDTNLSNVRSDMAMAAYNNRMYLVGGRSTSSPVSTVQIADINPTGTLGSWSTSTAFPTNIYGHSIKIYNDYLYVVGGASSVGGTPLSSIRYNKINSDGTLNTWVSAANMSTGRMNNGGDFSTVWGAYLYISGGCDAVNGSGYCTSIKSDTQVASINADGSLDTWSTMAGVSDQRTGSSLLSWRDRVYEVGGCSAQNTTTGDCNSGMLASINYGVINDDGDASTVDQSVTSGVGSCTGGSPTECDLPGTSNIGNMLNSSFISNGYLYVVGGCTNNLCSTTMGNVAYVAISSTGQMSKPATCPNGAYQGGTWCVDTVNTISGGLAAASPVIFNNRVYLVGGLTGSGNANLVNRTDLNSDGSINAWTSQSMTGLGMNSVSYLFAYARANPVSAGTNPGNLYVFGGCSASSSAGCTAYSANVYKCSIQVAGTLTGCTTTSQLQIGVIPGDSSSGLGIMSGTVYAGYIYLIGGVSPNQQDLKTVRYAKFDDSNNVVIAASSGWTESPNIMAVGRRRAAAFGYNGYIYVVGGYEAASGVLADIEFIKVNVSDGSLGTVTDSFHVSSVTISQRWGLSVPVSNSFAYVIGGCTVGASPGGCTTRTDVIQTFQIYNNDSGAPAGYSTSANTYGTSPNRIGVTSAVLNGYLYAAGGCTSTTDCTTAINTVSYAAIDVNGNVGTWTDTTAALPAVRAWGSLRSAGSSLYYIGGQSSTSTDRRAEVYYATPSSGNITSWGTASNGLPAGRTDFAATSWNNRLYVMGGAGTGTGCTGSNVCNTVYVSPQLNSGGNITSGWSTTSTSFDVARRGGTAISYANNLYLMGGYDGANYLSDVQYSKISPSTGNAGTWIYTASLPGPIANGDGFAANGYIYLIGGRSSATSCSPITLVAPISANTTISSGNNPTGIGEWYQTNQRYTGARYGNAAVYYNGKAYVIGGACGTTLTYASPVVQQTTLLTQPQVARYSIAVDTDSDVYPAYWLLNGVDNAIGAKWQLRYRSMTNPTTVCTSPAMTTWGQETVFGDVTLGLPGTYTPKNAAGTNTNCARYYYFNVAVDSSQAFGYPDDYTRGPTITDLTLQFTADPSKRLLHGRTFTGGLQQPVDTPLYSF
ncbi:MAG: hypothetical protein ABIP50_01075 [Candidatus Saccharimonadales bacterium]